jgi:tubulinyl-Tyr carboxypeptidase
MQAFVKQTYESVRALPDEELAPPPPMPVLPDSHAGLSVKQKICSIQKFISAFQYNYSGSPFVRMQKNRGMKHVSICAKQIITAALPIQCVEAVFLGCFLTAELLAVDRIPLSFKSKMNGNTHRHIVLAIRYEKRWGAIGISRRANLMHKDIRFDSLLEMVDHFQRSYEACYHRVSVVYVGLPFSHDVFSDMPIKWKIMRLSCHVKDRLVLEATLSTYTTNMAKMLEYFRREGTLEVKTGRAKVPTFSHIVQKKKKRKNKKKKGCQSAEDEDIDDDILVDDGDGDGDGGEEEANSSFDGDEEEQSS